MIDQEETVLVPPSTFIVKLWGMLNNPSYEDIIAWSESGDSFIIKDKERFTFDLLPSYFKHNNIASFLRQLNNYGFTKVHSLCNSNLCEFRHSCFLKDQPQLLPSVIIKRPGLAKELKSDYPLKDLLSKVQTLKKTQKAFEDKINIMEKHKNLLCEETSELKKKQQVQQKIIHNIMAFLASMVHHNDDKVNIENVRYSSSQNASNKNLMAITQVPHAELNKEFVIKTENNPLTDEEQEDEIIDFLLDNDVCKKEISPSEAANSINAIEVGLLEEDEYPNENLMPIVELQEYESMPQESYVEEFQENMDQLEELPIPSDVGVEGEPMSEEANKPAESKPLTSGINIADLDISKLVIFNPLNTKDNDLPPALESYSSEFSGEEASNAASSSNIQFVDYFNPKKELDDHVTSMESNINALMDILRDTNLNLDLNEVLELFTPDEISAITQEGTDECMLSD